VRRDTEAGAESAEGFGKDQAADGDDDRVADQEREEETTDLGEQSIGIFIPLAF